MSRVMSLKTLALLFLTSFVLGFVDQAWPSFPAIGTGVAIGWIIGKDSE